MEELKNYLPTIIRYALISAGSALAAKSWISPDQHSFMSQNADVIGGILVALATAAYGLFVKPSARGMEVAKVSDEKVPQGDTLVVQTPSGQPDIIVPGK
jgi:hypothetical protein